MLIDGSLQRLLKQSEKTMFSLKASTKERTCRYLDSGLVGTTNELQPLELQSIHLYCLSHWVYGGL